MELTDIFTDQQTGRNFERPEYLFLRKRIQPGDTLILTEIDQFRPEQAEILKELQYFEGTPCPCHDPRDPHYADRPIRDRR